MTSQRALVALRGVFYAGCFILLWSWLAVSVQPFDQRLPFAIPWLLRPLGMVLGLAGALLAGWCVGTFIVRGFGTPAPFDPPREVVVSGPYRYVRNPMYVGALSVILAAGLVLSSLSIVLLAAGFGLLAHVFVLLYEEPTLEDRFGAGYLRYKGAVNRWWPGSPSLKAA